MSATSWTSRRAVDGKRERWQRIIQEAAEQSGRARLPELARCVRFADAVRPAPHDAGLQDGMSLHSPYSVGRPTTRQAGSRPLREALAGCNLRVGTRIQVFIGPEGGFSEAEV